MTGKKQKTIYEMDTTHIVFLSLSGSFFLFSIINTVLSIFNSSYEINNKVLLSFALYAILFSLFTSSYVSPKVKSIGLFTLPFSISLLVFLAIHFNVDLNGLNNGLSLIALSISISLLPFRTMEEVAEKEMKGKMFEEIAYLKGEITRQNHSHKADKDELMKNWRGTLDQLEITLDDYRKLSSEMNLVTKELEKTKLEFSQYADHCELEKREMMDRYELESYYDSQHVEKLQQEIYELKKQKEDA
jgi:hypothetical protein